MSAGHGQLSEETVGAMKKLLDLTVVPTGYSCYLSAARRRRVRFFSPIESGPGGSGSWNGDRDKHWVQLLFKI